MKLRLLIDTNVLLDLVAKERPEHSIAKMLFETAIQNDMVELSACISSLKDVFYVYQRHYGSSEDAWTVVETLSRIVNPIPLNHEMLDLALERVEPDFEDALIAACAKRAGCDAVVSRDAKAFMKGFVRKIPPIKAIKAIETLA